MKICKNLFPFFIIFLSVNSVSGSDYLRQPDVRSMGTGGNGVTMSYLFNPSLVALSGEKSVQFGYSNRYGLKELGTLNGSFLWANNLLPAAIQLTSFGYDAYRKTMMRLAVGKNINKRWTAGVAVHYTLLQTELYDESFSRLSTDIGITFMPVDNLLIGFVLINSPSVYMGDKYADKERFGTYKMQIGFNWQFINNLFIIAYIGTSKEHTLVGSAGIEYVVFDCFYLRAGMKLKPLLPSAGIGYDLGSFTIDIAAINHEVLGISTAFGLTYSF